MSVGREVICGRHQDSSIDSGTVILLLSLNKAYNTEKVGLYSHKILEYPGPVGFKNIHTESGIYPICVLASGRIGLHECVCSYTYVCVVLPCA